MIRKLLIVFASGLAFAIIALSSAWLVGGAEMRRYFDRHDSFVIGHGDDKGPRSSRTFAFTGDGALTINMPVELSFTRGPAGQMVVTGPAKAIEALRWNNGVLDTASHFSLRGGGITVAITAPQLPRLEMNGPADVKLTDLDQPSLAFTANGATNLNASGKVNTLSLEANGAADLDLSGVEARDATVRISGVGNAEIAATGRVDSEISGAGNLTLHRKPASLKSRISGVGSVDHDY